MKEEHHERKRKKKKGESDVEESLLVIHEVGLRGRELRLGGR